MSKCAMHGFSETRSKVAGQTSFALACYVAKTPSAWLQLFHYTIIRVVKPGINLRVPVQPGGFPSTIKFYLTSLSTYEVAPCEVECSFHGTKASTSCREISHQHAAQYLTKNTETALSSIFHLVK